MNEREYTTYEYRTIDVPLDKEQLYRDLYRNFGWIIEPDVTAPKAPGVNAKVNVPGRRKISMKRDRRLKNREELSGLQRTCEQALENIDSLERSKTSRASIMAYTIGVIGTVFLALAVFDMSGYLALGVPIMLICSVLGVIGWILPYVVYRSIVRSRTRAVAPQIDQNYEIVYDTAEKAGALRSGV